MIAKERDPRRDYQLGERRMGVEERLAVQIVAGLADEVDFIEDDFGRRPYMPEAQPGRNPGKNHDRYGVDPFPRHPHVGRSHGRPSTGASSVAITRAGARPEIAAIAKTRQLSDEATIASASCESRKTIVLSVCRT